MKGSSRMMNLRVTAPSCPFHTSRYTYNGVIISLLRLSLCVSSFAACHLATCSTTLFHNSLPSPRRIPGRRTISVASRIRAEERTRLVSVAGVASFGMLVAVLRCGGCDEYSKAED